MPLRKKVPIALALRDALQAAQQGEVPDLGKPFEDAGARIDAHVRQRARLARRTLESALTRGFRSSFGLAALFALLASVPGATAASVAVRRLAVLLGAAVVLLVVELSLGAVGFGKPHLADPCTSKPAFEGGGLDGEVQRFALSGLNGAACKLHATREELVLSFVPAAGTKRVRWDRKTIEAALRVRLRPGASTTLEQRGLAGYVIGHVARGRSSARRSTSSSTSRD